MGDPVVDAPRLVDTEIQPPPVILPSSSTWKPRGRWGVYGGAYYNGPRSLGVIRSAQVEADGKRWLHVSVSHRERLPTWDELVEVKELFIGRAAVALQVLPPESEYVNFHPNVLHLWCCLDGRVTPDFRRDDGLV